MLRDPSEYDGEPICPRCGSGWAHCTDFGPTPERHYAHWETCAIYTYMDYLCDNCEEEAL